MCIRDRRWPRGVLGLSFAGGEVDAARFRGDLLRGLLGEHCLLYTSDAADDLLCVDLGGRRIIKKKKHKTQNIDTQH